MDWLYRTLSRNDAPEPADLIFVLAGRMERKRYALDLYRAGFAPRLLLSVGRFEVRKMSGIGFVASEELTRLRDRTPPPERHFFCEIDASRVRIEKVRLPRWNTYGELLGFRDWLARSQARSVIVISTAVHLRRVSAVFGKLFRRVPLKVLYCPVPAEYGFPQGQRWWTRRADFWFVVKEAVKLVVYRVILALPEQAITVLMRNKG